MTEQIVEVNKKMVRLTYNGKEVERELVVPGLVKAGNAFLVRCKRTGAWTYCNQARLDKLAAKFGSVEKVGENYVGRDGKKEIKKEIAAAAPVAAPAVAPATPVEA